MSTYRLPSYKKTTKFFTPPMTVRVSWRRDEPTSSLRNATRLTQSHDGAREQEVR